MQLFTPITLPLFSPAFLLNHQSQSISIGSCFAEHLAQKLSYYGFHSLCNPIGTLFHPLSIADFLKRCKDEVYFTDNDVFQNQDIFLCFETHSQCSAPTKHELLTELNATISRTRKELREATHLFITLGTSWVYRHKDSGKIVASCHKVPQRCFSKELLSGEQLRESYEQIMQAVLQTNPHIKLIFTISPVRHLKDGMVENQRSKALLISSLHDFLEGKSQQMAYFPAYEIILDELRDYRYFAKDLIHPSELAVDYVFEKFAQSLIVPSAYPAMKEVESLRKAMAHRPFNPNTPAHQAFEQQTQLKASQLKQQIPFLKF